MSVNLYLKKLLVDRAKRSSNSIPCTLDRKVLKFAKFQDAGLALEGHSFSLAIVYANRFTETVP